ncbi:MAG: ATP-binding protein [Gammaproteobacteria bacterium]|nr:ATP-binding protein [Gammaproteobacteria bacterium]
MLLRFGVANHRSIRDYQELLLTASKRIQKERLTTPVDVLGEAAVPVAALYGANASGKSNILEAMAEMQRLVVTSHKGADATDRIPRHPFALDDESAAKPTQFDCTFTLGNGDASGDAEEVYDYGFQVTDTEVVREWLHRTVRQTRTSTHRLFERETSDGEVQIDFGPQLRGENAAIRGFTRANSLFLSAAAQNNHPQLTPIQEWLASNWRCVREAVPLAPAAAANAIASCTHAEQLGELLAQADAGIGGVMVVQEIDADSLAETAAGALRDIFTELKEDAPTGQLAAVFANFAASLEGKRLNLQHCTSLGLRPLPYESESRGTRMLLSLLVPAFDALAKGSVLVVDELDSSLHPNLARAFLSLFETPESNPAHAQLIFSTHDVALLGSGLLANDEIWITEKNRDGASTFTPLTDFRIRSRVDVEMAYRNGRFGGTPNLQNFLLEAGRS